MTTKIRYSVQTSNKYSVIDPDKSEEETENKDVQELNRTKSLNETKVTTNNNDEKKTIEEKQNSVSKKESSKKIPLPIGSINTNARPDGYKYPIPSLNDVLNEKGTTNYQDNNYYGRGNLRSKFSRSRRIGYSSSGTNAIGKSNFYRGSRNYDYKPSNDRRGYTNAFGYKPDYREKGSNEYLEGLNKPENFKREHLPESKGKNFYSNRRTKDEGVHKKPDRKVNKTKSLEVDAKKKKNENSKEKDGKLTEGVVNTTNDQLSKLKNKEKSSERVNEEPTKADHSKKKTTMNLYEYILYEGTSIDKLPGFHRRYRNYNRKPEDTHNSTHVNSSNGISTTNGTLYKPSNQYSSYGNNNRSFKNKPKSGIDENILKNRDPPNINDTRAFPSLTSK